MSTPKIDTTLLKQVSHLPERAKENPDWITNIQDAAAAEYKSLELPNRTQHLWRYTDPAQFLYSNGAEPQQNGSTVPQAATKTEAGTSPVYDTALESLKSGELSVVAQDDADSSVTITLSAAAKDYGLVAIPLAQAGATHKDIIDKHLAKSVGADFGKFEALNATLWENGIFIYAPDDTTIEAPIHILHRGSAKTGWTFPRILIVTGENSKLTIIDEYFSANETVAGKSNSVVEIYGDKASSVEYVALQRNNTKTISHYTQRTTLNDTAESTLVAATFGGKTHKANLGTIMEGRQTKSLQYGIVFGSGKQSFDHHTEHVNRGANGYSNLDYKIVLKDKSHSAYTGLIRVDENIANCEAYQSNRNLLLNRGAKAESIPELEILCDEVVCTHGATVGPIDEMQVFYLLSRGIPRNEAVKMIVKGHVEPTLKILPESLQPRVRAYVADRLETL